MRGRINGYWRWVFGLSHFAYFTLIVTLWLSVYLKRQHTSHNVNISVDQAQRQSAARFFTEVVLLLGHG